MTTKLLNILFLKYAFCIFHVPGILLPPTFSTPTRSTGIISPPGKVGGCVEIYGAPAFAVETGTTRILVVLVYGIVGMACSAGIGSHGFNLFNISYATNT